MRSFGMTLAAALLLLSCSAWAAVYNVPGDAATIQEAIYLCVDDGDSVVVEPGIYTGAGNRDISLGGRKITVRSTDPNDAATVSGTVIDCEDSGRGFVFVSGETAESVVAGFTIINGNGGSGNLWGGGLYFASDSSPIISNCVIVDSSANFGGAIAVLSSSPTIRNCRILGNIATGGGGGLYINGGNTLIESCVISGNSAPNGGAVYSQNPGDIVLIHCTITTNTATYGGAIRCFFGSNMTLYGCILWDNTASTGAQMDIGGIGWPSSVDVSYCDIEGIDTDVMVYGLSVVNWGLGNMEAEPMFIEAGYFDEQGAYVEGDFGLLEGSPCLDAGDPGYVAEEGATDVYGAQRLLGEAIDIGAAEFVIEESEAIAIEAKIRLRPKVINLRGKQKWLFCTIKLEGYEAEDIDADSIEFFMGNESIKPIREKRHKRGKDLKVRFDMDEIREELIGYSERTIELTVQGALAVQSALTVQSALEDGATLTFAGSGELKVYGKKGKKGKK